MTLEEVMQQLEQFGSEQTKKVLVKHGAKEPFFGVKVADLQKLRKKIKKNYQLSLALYNTGNSDAMYLAGMIADTEKMSAEELQKWAEGAYWYYISDYAVAGVAASSQFAIPLGLSWIDSGDEFVQSCGWFTLSGKASVTADEELDLELYSSLLDRCNASLQNADNRVRYAMNNFMIAVGSYIVSLTEKAKQTASNVGKVNVYMGNTSCKVPSAIDYIQKVEDKGKLGKKRKTTIC